MIIMKYCFSLSLFIGSLEIFLFPVLIQIGVTIFIPLHFILNLNSQLNAKSIRIHDMIIHGAFGNVSHAIIWYKKKAKWYTIIKGIFILMLPWVLILILLVSYKRYVCDFCRWPIFTKQTNQPTNTYPVWYHSSWSILLHFTNFLVRSC